MLANDVYQWRNESRDAEFAGVVNLDRVISRACAAAEREQCTHHVRISHAKI